LLFDYDGTLSTNIDERPSETTIKILGGLCDDPHNIVFIISGRERSRLSDWFAALPKLGLAAEKGVYIKVRFSSFDIVVFPDDCGGSHSGHEIRIGRRCRTWATSAGWKPQLT
jgi:trehalose-6-phosphatase